MNELYLQAAAAMSPADMDVMHLHLPDRVDDTINATATTQALQPHNWITPSEQLAADMTTNETPAPLSIKTVADVNIVGKTNQAVTSSPDALKLSQSQSTQNSNLPTPAITTNDSAEGARHRQYCSHDWPPVGAILTAEYFGQTYHATVITARKKLLSNRQLRIDTGAEAGMICDSLSAAMLAATDKQRRENNLRRKGVANGWDFWQWDGK